MSVTVLFEAPVKPKEITNLVTSLANLLPESRKYEGCEGMDVYFNTEDKGRMVMIEKWASRAHHEKYLAWRTETGVMEKLGSMLAGPPSIRYFERVDA
jgi:quinol monooxygenase YgiN